MAKQVEGDRLTRWSLALQPVTFNIVHCTGTANGNADALFRAATDTITNASVPGEEGRNVGELI